MDDNSQNPNQLAHFVRTDEPRVKAAPALETGALKWMRENLFSSSMNTVLTILGIVIVIYSVVAVTRWAVQDANWHAVFINLRLLIFGRFEPKYEWRVIALTLISSFVMGAAIAVWVKKIARFMLVATIIVGIFAFLVPIAILSNVPLPVFNMAAGNIPVVLGSSTEMPIETIAFIGKAGEEVYGSPKQHTQEWRGNTPYCD
jgi:hypothetical protein